MKVRSITFLPVLSLAIPFSTQLPVYGAVQDKTSLQAPLPQIQSQTYSNATYPEIVRIGYLGGGGHH
jgi:hypothetical protein